MKLDFGLSQSGDGRLSPTSEDSGGTYYVHQPAYSYQISADTSRISVTLSAAFSLGRGMSDAVINLASHVVVSHEVADPFEFSPARHPPFGL